MPSGFAKLSTDLSYWEKQSSKPLFPDLFWNIPEQKTGTISLIGGNSQNFSAIVRTAEYLNHTFPLKKVTTVLPDSLKTKLPALENVEFTPSTSSGSFAKSRDLEKFFDNSNFTFIAGDLSHNAETAVAFTDAIKHSITPLLLTRDSIDLLAPTFSQIVEHPALFLVGPMLQLQKVFRALFYPRMILLSQPLVPVVETLHKFTLTYTNITILTFHEANLIVASNGNISTTHLVDTDFTPLSLWSGQLAARVAALSLYNPGKPFDAATSAILYH